MSDIVFGNYEGSTQRPLSRYSRIALSKCLSNQLTLDVFCFIGLTQNFLHPDHALKIRACNTCPSNLICLQNNFSRGIGFWCATKTMFCIIIFYRWLVVVYKFGNYFIEQTLRNEHAMLFYWTSMNAWLNGTALKINKVKDLAMSFLMPPHSISNLNK